jgi:segregation and condensation protein B
LSEPAAELPPDDEKKAARQLDRAIRDEIRALVDELIADYNTPDSGLEIREVAGGFRIGTRPENHDAVRAFVKTLKPPLKLSLQALETLAVIAYKQPVTAPEIGEIRGVDTSGVLGSLIARKLITTAGRKQVVGRPILYKTTKEFLLRFGLKDVSELPSIEEFEKMAADLADSDLAEPEEAGALATEEELPFAQNEIAEMEDTESSEDDLDADPAPTSEHDIAEQPK